MNTYSCFPIYYAKVLALYHAKGSVSQLMRHVRKYKLDILNYTYFHTPRKRWIQERRALRLKPRRVIKSTLDFNSMWECEEDRISASMNFWFNGCCYDPEQNRILD